MASADDHRRDYAQYDRRVDLVSVAEVWFTRSQGLAPSTVHFDRFPRLVHPVDGRPATPDFTVLFSDDTGIVGEISHIAPRTSALAQLINQVARYETLGGLPSGPPDAGGARPVRKVRAIDVIVFAPVNGINQAIDELAEIIDDAEHPYQPEHPPMLLSYSYDGDDGSYTFQRPARGRNEHTRDHSRAVAIGSWLRDGHDELRGLPKWFQSVKASARFMNDDPPALYIATVLWNFIFPDLAADAGIGLPANLAVTESELVERLQQGYGYAASVELIRVALDFLRVARLCEPAADGWRIYYRNLGRVDREISEALLHEHFSKANKRRRIKTAAVPDEGSERRVAEDDAGAVPLFPSAGDGSADDPDRPSDS